MVETERRYSVYLYTFPDGMKYVGMTSLTLAERRDCGYQHNSLLQKAIKDCGGWGCFSHVIVADNLSRQEAESVEKSMIHGLRKIDPSKVYNISAGGRETFLGLKHKSESKQAIADANKNKVVSRATREKLSDAMKGKMTGKDNPRAQKVVQYSSDGNPINFFDTVTEAARSIGVDRRCISDCIRGRQKTSGGFVWKKFEGGD